MSPPATPRPSNPHQGTSPQPPQPSGDAHRLRPYVVAILAVALWSALRLLPGDITPEAPETFLRQEVRRAEPPRRLPQPPAPFPSYEPRVAYSLLDHLPEAQTTLREAPDPQGLRRRVRTLRNQLSSRWLSVAGDWRVAGEGVLTCFVLPTEPDRLAAALRPPPPRAPKGLAVRVRFVTPPQPEERAGLTPGLDTSGSGVAFLVGYDGPRTLLAEWVLLKDYRITEVLAQEKVAGEPFPSQGPGPWLTVTAAEAGDAWQGRVGGRLLLGAAVPSPRGGRPGVVLRSAGTRAAFFGFTLEEEAARAETEAALERRLAEAVESLRLADLAAAPAEPNFSYRPPEGTEERKQVSARWVTIGEVTRPAVLAPAPSELHFALPEVRGSARFEAWVGIHPRAWSRRGSFSRPDLPADEFRAEVVLKSEEGEKRLWSQALKATRPQDRGWVRVEVPLARVPTPGTLILRGLSAGSPAAASPVVRGGYLVWGNPVLRFDRPEATYRNVIILVVDSLRADALSGPRADEPQGSRRAERALSERLAAEGFLFENAFSQAPWCVPALASIHSSLWPEVHGANPLDFRVPGSLSPAAATLAEVLRRAGYRTAWMSDQAPPQRVNLEQGFEEVIVAAGGADPLFERAERWLTAQAREPFFLYLHTYRLAAAVSEVLAEPPQDLDLQREKLRRAYRSALGGVEGAGGRFVEALAARGLLRRTLLVLTGDHGTDLSERYPTIIAAGPGFTLHQEQLHVPLIIRPPGGASEPRRVAAQARLIDLAPTVSELLGLEPPGSWQGASLVPLVGPGGEGAGAAEGAAFASAANHPPERAALRYQGYTYIRILYPEEPRGRIFLEPLAEEQLYNVRLDPGERENLAAREPERLARMRQMLQEHRRQTERERRRRFPEVPARKAAAEGRPQEAQGPDPAAERSETTP